jgi:hypothetical protein
MCIRKEDEDTHKDQKQARSLGSMNTLRLEHTTNSPRLISLSLSLSLPLSIPIVRYTLNFSVYPRVCVCCHPFNNETTKNLIHSSSSSPLSSLSSLESSSMSALSSLFVPPTAEDLDDGGATQDDYDEVEREAKSKQLRAKLAKSRSSPLIAEFIEHTDNKYAGDSSSSSTSAASNDDTSSHVTMLSAIASTEHKRPPQFGVGKYADIDRCIELLENGSLLPEPVVKHICAQLTQVLIEELNVVPIAAPVTVVGDVHG